MTRHHYCTLFDKNYLYKGLALYRSLESVGADFHLWILCMDQESYDCLQKLHLQSATLIPLNEVEDVQLAAVKPGRTATEYCWTLTPSLPLFLLRKKQLKEVTYVDADLFFYSDPEPIFTELGKAPVLLIEHRYTRSQQYLEKFSGRFNVQFMTFTSDQNALKALEWWRERCLEWCFHRYEDGKLGDQLYLHDWPERFPEVHILENLGAGVAPWNVQQYDIERSNADITVNSAPIIFYHFHALYIHSLNSMSLAPGYWIPSHVKKLIYKPYFQALKKSIQEVKNVDENWSWGYTPRKPLLERLSLFAVALKKYIIDRGIPFYDAKSFSR